MLAKNEKEFINLFKELDDFREDGKVLYPLDELLFLCMVGVLSCAESWQSIVDFGQQRLAFLRQYFPFEHGIPSKSTLCSVLGALDTKQFEQWFNQWADKLCEKIPSELVALDGKKLRGSKRIDKKACYVLNAFATQRGIVLAQQSIPAKNNEISALPELIQTLDIKDTVVSIDAIGCQKTIVHRILEQGANYMIALKANQGELLDDIDTYFSNDKSTNNRLFYEEFDKGHGRLEHRRCWSEKAPSWLCDKHPSWKGLNSIILVERERNTPKKTTHEKQYYISSLAPDAKVQLDYSRNHWCIENQVHWVLDVIFNEDRCSINQAAANMSIIRKVSLNMLREYKKKFNVSKSVPGIRQMMAWSEDVAKDILSIFAA